MDEDLPDLRGFEGLTEFLLTGLFGSYRCFSRKRVYA
jgi:hypothetical protein